MEPLTFVRLPEVQRRLGLGKTKVYELIKTGQLPEPKKVGRASIWLERDITNFQARIIGISTTIDDDLFG